MRKILAGIVDSISSKVKGENITPPTVEPVRMRKVSAISDEYLPCVFFSPSPGRKIDFADLLSLSQSLPFKIYNSDPNVKVVDCQKYVVLRQDTYSEELKPLGVIIEKEGRMFVTQSRLYVNDLVRYKNMVYARYTSIDEIMSNAEMEEAKSVYKEIYESYPAIKNNLLKFSDSSFDHDYAYIPLGLVSYQLLSCYYTSLPIITGETILARLKRVLAKIKKDYIPEKVAKSNVFYQKGQEYLTENNYSEAAKNYKKSLNILDTDCYFLHVAGCFCQLGQYEEAIRLLKQNLKYVRSDMEFIHVNRALAWMYKASSNYKEAIKCLRKILELKDVVAESDIDIHLTYMSLGECFQELKDYKSGLKYTKLALESMKSRGVTGRIKSLCAQNIVFCYERLKSYREAVRYAKTALIEYQPVNKSEVQPNEGRLLAQKKELVGLLVYRSYLYCTLKQYKPALKYAKLAEILLPNDLSVVIRLLQIYYELDLKELALKLANKRHYLENSSEQLLQEVKKEKKKKQQKELRLREKQLEEGQKGAIKTGQETEIVQEEASESEVEESEQDREKGESGSAKTTNESEADKAKQDYFRKKIKKLVLPEDVKMVVEIMLKQYPDFSDSEKADHHLYLERLLEFPWGKYEGEQIDLLSIKNKLDKTHYGLEKIKQRILEAFVYYQRNEAANPPILCFVGPPGIGKTSIAQSIASSLGRKLVRLPLGGVNDTVFLRGMPRSYRSAAPGQIISLIKQSGVMNPVMILDELDKLDAANQSSIEGILLKLLDPEQNHQFNDDYFVSRFDLSKVTFIATANSVENISPALLDRMEVIHLNSYTDQEKLYIARKYLLPKILKAANRTKAEINIKDSLLKKMITDYTREPGVRNLNRLLNNLVQKYEVSLLTGKAPSLNQALLQEYFADKLIKTNKASKQGIIGRANGLAWSYNGGSILPIEARLTPGNGKIKSTGKLGEILKESIEAAYSCVLADLERIEGSLRANDLYDYERLKKHDLHIHFPENAIPKDGPSAGIAIYTTITSILTEKKIKQDIAMTGEITLYGDVLAIGGLHEKLAAAKRHRIRKVIVPTANQHELAQLSAEITSKLEIITIDKISEVWSAIFNETISGCKIIQLSDHKKSSD